MISKDELITIVRNYRKNVLFLLRAYNDLDHMAPIVWKMSSVSIPTLYMFVDKEFRDDYRVKHFAKSGAREIHSSMLDRYYNKLRKRLSWSFLIKLFDRVLGRVLGRRFLIENRIGVVVAEWGGPDGKGKMPFVLRPARSLGIPTVAVPHGYHTWYNNDFNTTTAMVIETTGMLPQFTNRNLYTNYIVQSDNIKRYCIESGIQKEKLYVLGSARFCKEWSEINQNLCMQSYSEKRDLRRPVVVFFLNHWTYNVDRDKCINLIKQLSEEKIELIIKGHTRGVTSGTLTPAEEALLEKRETVSFAGPEAHSPALVELADIVIVYGSSICFEALRQRTLVCRPLYLCRNNTIFEGTGLVYEARSEEEVTAYVRNYEIERENLIDETLLKQFFDTHVENNNRGEGVLQEYVNLIHSNIYDEVHSVQKVSLV